jgi:hypothetical protein
MVEVNYAFGISIIIILLANAAFGFAGMGGSKLNKTILAEEKNMKIPILNNWVSL